MRLIMFALLAFITSCSSYPKHSHITKFNSNDFDEDENSIIVIRPYYVEKGNSSGGFTRKNMTLFSVLDKAANFVGDIVNSGSNAGNKKLAEATFKNIDMDYSFTIGSIKDENLIGKDRNNFHIAAIPSGKYILTKFKAFDGSGKSSSVIDIKYDSARFGEVWFNVLKGDIIYVGDIALEKGSSPKIYDNYVEANHYSKADLSKFEKKLGKRLIFVNENEWISY